MSMSFEAAARRRRWSLVLALLLIVSGGLGLRGMLRLPAGDWPQGFTLWSLNGLLFFPGTQLIVSSAKLAAGLVLVLPVSPWRQRLAATLLWLDPLLTVIRLGLMQSDPGWHLAVAIWPAFALHLLLTLAYCDLPLALGASALLLAPRRGWVWGLALVLLLPILYQLGVAIDNGPAIQFNLVTELARSLEPIRLALAVPMMLMAVILAAAARRLSPTSWCTAIAVAMLWLPLLLVLPAAMTGIPSESFAALADPLSRLIQLLAATGQTVLVLGFGLTTVIAWSAYLLTLPVACGADAMDQKGIAHDNQ
jgi:hypothetical protein